MVAELHASHVRAHNATVLAISANLEFESRFVAFSAQSTRIIDLIGADNFLDRFDSNKTAPPLLEKMNDLVREYNDNKERLDARLSPEHVASFNPDPAAHGGATHSGSSEGLQNLKPYNLKAQSLVDKEPFVPGLFYFSAFCFLLSNSCLSFYLDAPSTSKRSPKSLSQINKDPDLNEKLTDNDAESDPDPMDIDDDDDEVLSSPTRDKGKDRAPDPIILDEDFEDDQEGEEPDDAGAVVVEAPPEALDFSD